MTIDWFTFAAQLVNFLVLIALLKRFLYTPIRSALAEREARTAQLERNLSEKAAATEREQQRLKDQQATLANERQAWLAARDEENSAHIAEIKAATGRELEEMRRREILIRNQERGEAVDRFSEQLSQAFMDATAQALRDLAGRSLTEAQIARFAESLQALDSETRERWSRQNLSTPPLVVRSALPLTPDQKERLRNLFSSELKRSESPSFAIVPELVDGLEVTLGDTTLGWSVRSYLETLSTRLRG
jgi:F-type H+-transporting ATPase subunit b